MLPVIPAWFLVVIALLSAHCSRRQQGVAFAIPRFYIALMYAAIAVEAFGDPARNNLLYVAVNRYGFLLIFLADIIPNIVKWWKARK